MTITNTFRMHVDPSLYAFKWKDAEYINVTYTAQKVDEKIIITTDISGPMYLLGMIACCEKWIEFDKEVQSAAKANAERKFDNEQLHPIFKQALAPFIPT